MNTAIITFFASFAGIILMIALKAIELRTGKRSAFVTLPPSVRAKTDHTVRVAYHHTRTFVSYFNRKSAVALVQWIAYHILSWARSFYILLHRKAHAHPPSKKVIDMVRGKVDVSTNTGASFYLKKISEEDLKKQGSKS